MKITYDENVFWNITWLTIGAVFVAFFSIVTSYYSNKNETLAKALTISKYPMEVGCAFKLEELTDKTLCTLVLTNRLKSNETP